jgi:transcriptional regulator with XRE-family HTH domain
MVKLRSLRTKRQWELGAVAERLGIPSTQLSKYERGWEPIPVTVLRDLAVMFECDVEKVTGKDVSPTEWKDCPHSILNCEEEYGGLYIRAAGHELSYPISLRERARLFDSIDELTIQQMHDRPPRILVETLNARWVVLNMAHVRKFELASDDETATPYYAHPEVYCATKQNEEREGDFGPVLTQALREHYKELGEEAAEAEVSQMKLIWADGTIEEDLYLYDEWVGTALYATELNLEYEVKNPFVMLQCEGAYQNVFFNLDHVAVLEAPLERLRRLTAPEE